MTSGILSSNKKGAAGIGPDPSDNNTVRFLTRQRELLRRRLWPSALTFLCYLLYHVVGTATVVLLVLQGASAAHMSAAQKADQIGSFMCDIFGTHSIMSPLLAFPLAAILAIEGFAWMDDRQEVDFYESQPVPRLQRFLDICLSGFLYFIFSYAITLEAGLLIAVGAGALTRAVLIDILLQAVRTAAFFLSVYALGVLSAMLTGNVVIAWLAFFVLLFYETLCKTVLRAYCSVFFATWSPRSAGGLLTDLFAPLYHYNSGGGTLEASLRLLALAALYFLLAWICCRLRRNECAGTAVVFAPVRTVVRIALSLLAGLITGLIFTAAGTSSLLPVLWMLLFTVIGACIMQIIYESGFHALFRRPLEIGAAVVLVLAVYLCFRFDAAGYDSYVPDPDKVADAALIPTEYYGSLLDEEGKAVSADDFGEKYMHLENVEDVTAVAAYGQEFTCKKKALNGGEGTIFIETENAGAGSTGVTETIVNPYDGETTSVTVLYRMKNGETTARCFELPASIDPAMMDAVTGTPAYREGTFNICHDRALRTRAGRCSMDYTNGTDYSSLRLDPAKYESFREAYLQDLSQFDYTFARTNLPVGKITVACDALSMRCPVYASFENTIAFLRENGIWLEPFDYAGFAARNAGRKGELSSRDQALVDAFDYWDLRGPFSPSYFY